MCRQEVKNGSRLVPLSHAAKERDLFAEISDGFAALARQRTGNGAYLDRSTKIGTIPPTPTLRVRFYRNASGAQPVADWLRAMGGGTRHAIGADLKTVEFGWPLGMPLV